MSLKNISEISTIEGPEFINLSPLDINPLMDKCEIKVFYLGHNRNRSYITREVADEMAKTLRGAPIVASWRAEKEDYGTHGHVMTVEEDGTISFSCKTIPYGFVSPDAKVWYQNFTDVDEFGNQVERTYLMTTGYLWTGQFQEIQKAILEGQPQSMELEENTLNGHWAKDDKLNAEFFIINDATFSKLCILGDDVEPCFEGSSVTSPTVSKEFSIDKDNFNNTLFAMVNELKQALQSEGGSVMELDQNTVLEEDVASEEVEFEAEASQSEDIDFSTEAVEETVVEEFVEEEEEEEDNKAESDSDDSEEEEEEKPASSHSLEEYELLSTEVESLRAEVAALREFKLEVENREKDELINQYFMLSDEDKQEIIDHKAEYSLDEIKSKLAVLYVEKNVDFSSVSGEIEEDAVIAESPITSFSLEEPVTGFAPSFLSALRETAKN